MWIYGMKEIMLTVGDLVDIVRLNSTTMVENG